MTCFGSLSDQKVQNGLNIPVIYSMCYFYEGV